MVEVDEFRFGQFIDVDPHEFPSSGLNQMTTYDDPCDLAKVLPRSRKLSEPVRKLQSIEEPTFSPEEPSSGGTARLSEGGPISAFRGHRSANVPLSRHHG